MGKSLIALLLAVCVAARRPFLARTINLAAPASVVYVVAEGGRFVGPRLRAICEEYHVPKADLANLHILRRPIALTDMLAVEQFIEAVHARLSNRPLPALILFDTVTKCLGRAAANENDPLDMALLADRIDAIIEGTGAAVGLIDHTGWKGEHERGHSNKRGNVETAILVQATADKSLLKLTCEKSNHADDFKAINVRIEQRADAAVITLPKVSIAPTASVAPTAASKPLLKNDAKALLALSKEAAGVAFGRWANIANLSQASLDRARQRLLAAGLVAADGPDSRPRYTVTAAGRERAAELEKAAA